MRRYPLRLAGAILAVSVLGGAGARAFDAESIAFVDMERVFSSYHKTEKADTELKKRAEEFNEGRNELIEELREMESEFNAVREEAQDETLTEEARERKRGEAETMLVSMREKEQELQTFEKSRRQELEEQGRRMRTRIVDDIRDILKNYALERGLVTVVDSSGPSLNQIPVFMYTDEDLDVTADILTILNKGQPEAEEGDEGAVDDAEPDDAGDEDEADEEEDEGGEDAEDAGDES